MKERLGATSISLNHRNLQALIADGVKPEQITDEQRISMDSTGQSVVRKVLRVAGEPVGTETSSGI